MRKNTSTSTLESHMIKKDNFKKISVKMHAEAVNSELDETIESEKNENFGKTMRYL